jgi:murein DD-endopeptidase MepM/ murein hydrolase activator NlpD
VGASIIGAVPRLLIALAAAAVLALPSGAAAASWAWPLHGAVAGSFHVLPAAPYAAGQRRGIDISGAPHAAVRAACPGRVRFAGPVPGHGLAVTVACGTLRATYLRLGSLRVRAGAVVAAGFTLGTLGRGGLLRLGARRVGQRFGYLDPLTLLRASRAPPPGVVPARRVARIPRRRRARPRPAPVRPAMPVEGWLAVGLIACGLPVGGLVRGRRRQQARVATRGVRAARL